MTQSRPRARGSRRRKAATIAVLTLGAKSAAAQNVDPDQVTPLPAEPAQRWSMVCGSPYAVGLQYEQQVNENTSVAVQAGSLILVGSVSGRVIVGAQDGRGWYAFGGAGLGYKLGTDVSAPGSGPFLMAGVGGRVEDAQGLGVFAELGVAPYRDNTRNRNTGIGTSEVLLLPVAAAGISVRVQ